jgi:hypothetical protein
VRTVKSAERANFYESRLSCFVSGHDFKSGRKGHTKMRALAPEVTGVRFIYVGVGVSAVLSMVSDDSGVSTI